MSRKMIGAIFLGLAWAGALAAQEPVQGAKELFYDPVGAGATRVSPGAQAPSSGTGRPQPARPLVRRDGNGRRTVSLPPNPEARATPTALGISYWIELQGASGGPGQQVTERHVFHSGERIRLHFRSNSDGNIALIQLGSSGTSQILFPDPEKGLADSRLAADQDKVLPQDSAWFRFDDKPGTERLIVLFARNHEEPRPLPSAAEPEQGGYERPRAERPARPGQQGPRHRDGDKDGWRGRDLRRQHVGPSRRPGDLPGTPVAPLSIPRHRSRGSPGGPAADRPG